MSKSVFHQPRRRPHSADFQNKNMVYFPVRKCYYIAKVSLLLILVVAILGLFEKWRGGKRAASAFSDPLEDLYERQILEDEAKIIPGLGEGGVAAYLTGEDKKKGEESEKQLAMNVYLSDRIAYNRTLKDQRNPSCDRLIYDAELPSASVILIFHNEPYSVVVRTIWSVINSCRRDQPWFSKANYVDRDGRTMKLGYPGQDPTSSLIYLKEIILVDDNSTLPDLKGKLSHYVRTRLPPDLIRILRLPDRQGLMKARIRGARSARGDVLVFLDAHCEAETDWLRPLLQRVRDKRDAVVTPIIDVLEQSTFRLDAAEVFQVGGFTFTGHFTWIDVPELEKKRRGSDISPTWSPTMAGGLFAINRAYYWELGAYDEQMAGWGGENLEMSFRIWQCGGTLETIPCSRVGHVFRSFHPYSMPANSDTHGINTARMAEVWMDEYAELFYLHRPDLRNNPKIGDVTHRKILREKLKCKSFQWFLDNIYREKFVPVRDAYGYGRFKNPSTGLCIDTLQREGDQSPLGVYPCHPDLQATQYFSLSLSNELRDEESCAQIQFKSHTSNEDESLGRKLFMSTCHGQSREQKWKFLPATKQIQHMESRLCLDSGTESGADLLAKPCADAKTQQWEIDYTEDNDFKRFNDVEPSDQETRLNRLRGQRRKSRSLLSYDDSQRRRRHKKHHKRSKKNKTKNKFILKLVRTLMNNTEDHLEVDIHCKHRQLYPNNTFVRDLVTILNERNIKVINNGRVFERNKVTQLDPKEDEEKKVLNKMDITPREEDTQQFMKKSRPRKRKPTAPENLIPNMNAIDDAPNTEHERTAPNANDYEQNAYSMTADERNANALERIVNGNELLSGNERLKVNERVNVSELTSLPPRSHRIIIEDFIEMTPAIPTHSKRMRKRKRKRLTTAAPAPALEEDSNIVSLIAQKLDRNVEEQINVPPQSEEKESMEDTPMLSESETADTRSHPSEPEPHTNKQTKHTNKQARERKRDRDIAKKIIDAKERDRDMGVREREKEYQINDNAIDERWPIGESRFRVKESGRRRHRVGHIPDSQTPNSIDIHTETDDSEVEQHTAVVRASPAPVKVVMRSNLTFNLGEEFFKWRAKNKENEADSALTIPGARNPPVQAWLRGDVTPAPAHAPDDDVIATGHLAKHTEERKRETEERSSESDSTSSD